MVMDGARWNLGSGKEIKVWGQPWLKEEVNPCVTSECQGLEHATVASLMYTDRRQWDIDIIQDLFNSRDQQSILNTPIPDEGEEDCFFWDKENSDCFFWDKKIVFWNNTDNQSLWKTVWRIKAPPKVLNMVWRAFSSCLPTKTVLYSRYVPIDTRCPVCNGEDESIRHILVECPFADQCWRSIGRVCSNSGENGFPSWLEATLSQTRKDEHATIVTLCWNIWKARNNLVWSKIKSSVIGVVASTKQYLADWLNAQNNSTKALFQDIVHGDGVVHWVKPQKDVVKISVDAATFSEFSSFGIGLLARDHEGGIIEGRSERFQGDKRPEWAEAVAIKEALSWVKEKGWTRVVIESDCLAVIQAIRSNVSMISPFGQVILECRKMIRELNIEMFFVKRSANMAAHLLARASYSFPGRVFDRRSIPIELKSILLADLVD